MFSKQTLAILLLLGLAGATFNFVHGIVSFVAYQAANGNAVALKIYNSCVEKQNSGVTTSSGAECVYHCSSYIFQALASVLVGGYGVATVQSGFGNAQETESSSPPTRRRDGDAENHFLDEFNGRLSMAYPGTNSPKGTALVHSTVHPADGFAIQMNIHGDNSTLHIHTNGTHAMAKFEDADHLERRAYLPTKDHYYDFTGVNGLKVEGHTINHPSSSDYTSDVLTAIQRFTDGDLSKPAFESSDSWTYEVCNSAKTATFFYGKMIAELDRPGNNYEQLNPPGCG